MNGWQRLWLLLTLILAGIVGAVVIAAMPSRQQSLERRATFSMELGLKAMMLKAAQANDEQGEFKARYLLEQGPATVRREAYPDMADELLIERVRPTLVGTPYEHELTARERNDDANVHSAQRELILSGLFTFIAISFGTYVLGWGIAWVRRGFRQNKA